MNPQYLKLWTRPSHYIGASWPDYYVFLARTRDSDCLERSNFDAGLKAIGGEQTGPDEDNPLVIIVRESHWLCGWVEWIAIHSSAESVLAIADNLKARLNDYPVLDEDLFSQYETDEANQIWQSCYRPAERIAYIRKHRSQFDFRDFQDLIACIRGKYFAGYASELIL